MYFFLFKARAVPNKTINCEEGKKFTKKGKIVIAYFSAQQWPLFTDHDCNQEVWCYDIEKRGKGVLVYFICYERKAKRLS